MTNKATFSVNGSTPPFLTASHGQTLTLALLDPTGIRSITYSIIGYWNGDVEAGEPSITKTGTPSGVTATLVLPTPGEHTSYGAAYGIRCDVVDNNREPHVFKAGVYVEAATGRFPIFPGEELERDTQAGWSGVINEGFISTWGGAQNLHEVLEEGNTTDGYDIVLSSGDKLTSVGSLNIESAGNQAAFFRSGDSGSDASGASLIFQNSSVFGGSEVYLDAGDGEGATANGGFLTITAGSSQLAQGGGVNIRAGNGATTGGSISLYTGGGADPGNFNVLNSESNPLIQYLATDDSVNFHKPVSIKNGYYLDLEDGGTLRGVNGLGIESGGELSVEAVGYLSVAMTNVDSGDPGGEISIGAGSTDTSGIPGDVQIFAGSSTDLSAQGGGIYLWTGSGSTRGEFVVGSGEEELFSSKASGGFTVNSSAHLTGSLTVDGGEINGADGNYLDIKAGQDTGSGAGDLTLAGGQSVSGASGSVEIRPGGTLSGTYGNVRIQGGGSNRIVVDGSTVTVTATTGITGNTTVNGSFAVNGGNLSVTNTTSGAGNITTALDPHAYSAVTSLTTASNANYDTALPANGFYTFTVTCLVKLASAGTYRKVGAVVSARRVSGTLTLEGTQTNLVLGSTTTGITMTLSATSGNLRVNIANATGETVSGRIHVGWELEDLLS